MKSRAFKLFILLLALLLPPVSAFATEGEAAEISARFSEENGALIVEADEPVAQLYIEWDLIPASGFLHEHISFETPAERVSIALGNDARPRKLYAFGPGDAPAWVQKWQPPLDDADLLLLPTHADDEHLYFGGAMPYYAGEKNMAVQVAYLTRHGGEPYRWHELLNGLWEVGVRNYPVISDFPDQFAENIEQAKQIYSEDEWLAYQVELLRRFKPEVVVGHDLNGEYGHGGHILNAQTLLAAAPLAGDAAQFPASAEQYGVWEPQKLYLHLYAENAIVMDWSVPLARFGGRTALDMAKAGYDKHVSQHIYYFAVEDFGPYDCRKFGLAFSTVGPDVSGDDLFENVVWPEPEPEPEPESESETEPEPVAVSALEPEPKPEPEPEPEQRAQAPQLLLIVALSGGAALLAVVLAITLAARRGRRP